MRKITCLCEYSFEINFPEHVDLEKEKDVMDKILDGNFMTVNCPQCQTLLKPELPFRLIDNSRSLDIFFIPEMDRSAFLMDNLEYQLENPARVVIGYKELVEKLIIFKSGLDDKVIETIKYYILSKAQSTEHTGEIFIYFHGKQDDKLVFYIEGLKEDEIAQYDVSNSVYDKAALDLDKKESDTNFASFLNPPYVSLNKVYME